MLTRDLRVVRSFGTKCSGGGQFNLPFNIVFDEDNKLYVTDNYNDRVQVLTTEGQFLGAFSQKAKGKKLYHPWAIAIDSSNTVYSHPREPTSLHSGGKDQTTDSSATFLDSLLTIKILPLLLI